MEKEKTIRRLNLGAGLDIRKGYEHHDYKKFEGIDYVFDLEKYPYPIKLNTYDVILANHIVEHISNIFDLFNELHRITKPNGLIKIEVPHYSVNFAFTQIDHKHYFGLDSLSILEPSDFQNKTKPFKIISQRILFRGEKSSKIMQIIAMPINFLVNLNHFTQLITDRFISKIIPFYFMEYTLRVLK